MKILHQARRSSDSEHRSRAKLYLIVLAFFVNGTLGANDNETCGIRNRAFKEGEMVSFRVYYSLIGLYVSAGTAVFNTSLEPMQGLTVYHVVGEGRSNSSYDWIYSVRDKYESYVDTSSLRPYKFIRRIQEGSYKKYENISFNYESGTAISSEGVYKIPSCVQDLISSVYYARNISFENHRPGDNIPFSMFIDNKIFEMYIQYLGREMVKNRFGTFRAHKVSLQLLEGNAFKGGEKMTLWFSDDANHLPLKIESPISVGRVKVEMAGFMNLRHPVDALIKSREE